MRAFVTGGSGFVGRNLLEALRQRGDTVRALARSGEAIDVVSRRGAMPVRGDLDTTEVMRDAMRGFDVVFHVAALASEWGAPKLFHRINVEGTRHVIAAARDAGVSRLVHVSTEAVLLGGPPLRNADETRPRPFRPVGPYGWSKGLAEAEVLAENQRGLETVVVRPRLIWGAGDTTVLPRMVQAVRDGKFMWIAGGRPVTCATRARGCSSPRSADVLGRSISSPMVPQSSSARSSRRCSGRRESSPATEARRGGRSGSRLRPRRRRGEHSH